MWKGNKNGNGVTGYLFLNGEQLDTFAIAGSDGVGVTRTILHDLKVGEKAFLNDGKAGFVAHEEGHKHGHGHGHGPGEEHGVLTDSLLPAPPV